MPFDIQSASAIPVLLFGSGGQAKVVIDILNSQAALFRVVGIVDIALKTGSLFHAIEVLGSDYELEKIITKYKEAKGMVAIGDCHQRYRLVNDIKRRFPYFSFIQAIHPSAYVASTARIGEGTVVMPGAVVNASAVIGDHCIINTHATIEHDCCIKDFVNISPNVTLGGGVIVEELVMMGMSSTVVPNKRIACHAVIGAGAVVIHNIPEKKRAFGIPARVIA
ncbi:MAG TPA: acetyltransferase [Coxiellaceae bacterium]|nr:acetyltransferase [Coxiellaceae bacterium]